MAAEKYNLVNYGETNFKYSMLSVEYGPIHQHPEIEVSILLYGSCRVDCMGKELTLKEGDLWIFNAMRNHQTRTLSSESNAIILKLQLTADFFKNYFPTMENIEFPFMKINQESVGPEAYQSIVNSLFAGAESFFTKKEHYPLISAASVNQLFFFLLNHLPYQIRTPEETLAAKERTLRLRSLFHYIDSHYKEPLYLTDLAELEGLSMSRLSHIFKECLGISFQEYLAQVRCIKAKKLLETTELKLIDISMECGFSDPKYFNRDFKKLYQRSPKDYRKRYQKRLEEAKAHGYSVDTESSVFTPLITHPAKNASHPILGEGIIFYEEDDALVVLQYCKEEHLFTLP